MTTRVGLALVGAMLCLVAACGRGSVARSRRSPTSPSSPATRAEERTGAGGEIALPAPVTKGTVSLEEALLRRRSVRWFRAPDLEPAQIGQLLWAGQGISNLALGRRTAPSAGKLYPMKLYVVKRDGVFMYAPAGHKLLQLASDDRRSSLVDTAGQQTWILSAPVIIVISGNPDLLRRQYRDRSERYLYLEGGHIAQNILLQAVSLGLGSVPVGAFDDGGVAKVVGLPAEEQAVYLLPVGYPGRR